MVTLVTPSLLSAHKLRIKKNFFFITVLFFLLPFLPKMKQNMVLLGKKTNSWEQEAAETRTSLEEAQKQVEKLNEVR